MRILLNVIAFIVPILGWSQKGNLIEIKDFRSGKDSILEKRPIPNTTKLTSKYICRNFDFCIALERKWLTEIQKDEISLRPYRADRSYLITERDSIHRIKLEVHINSLQNTMGDFGYYYKYPDNENTVIRTELTSAELSSFRKGIMPEFEIVQDRKELFIRYGDNNSIIELKYSQGQQLLFSMKLME